MLLNTLEFMAMNNPIRAIVQDMIEAKTLRTYSTLAEDKVALEIGCGNGTGTKLIQKYFHPREIYAIDLDPKMINIAKKNNKNKNIYFEVGDASKLQFENNRFDAIFDFGIIHHIPNWKDCLQELRRVLKPHGQLILEDLSIETFENSLGKILKKVLDHPYNAMYKQEEFISFLEHLNFTIKAKKTFTHLGFRYFIVIAEK